MYTFPTVGNCIYWSVTKLKGKWQPEEWNRNYPWANTDFSDIPRKSSGFINGDRSIIIGTIFFFCSSNTEGNSRLLGDNIFMNLRLTFSFAILHSNFLFCLHRLLQLCCMHSFPCSFPCSFLPVSYTPCHISQWYSSLTSDLAFFTALVRTLFLCILCHPMCMQPHS